MKLLSVIVPIYNAEKYLKTCIDSLVNQTYEAKEIILVDDGSTDSSASICDEYCEKFDFITAIHQKNAGVMAARNNGLDIAKGDYIILCDADDGLDLDAYEIMINALESTGSDVSVCGFKDEYENFHVFEKHQSIPKAKVFKDKKSSLVGIFNGLGGFIWNKVFKRKVIENIRFRDDVAITDDLQFTWDAFTLGGVNKTCYIDLPMYHYRYIFSSVTKASNIEKQIKALNAWENIKRDLDQLKLTDQVINNWAQSYIVWNVKICEKMLFANKPNKQAYLLAKKNIEEYRFYIGLLDKRHKILATNILKSWNAYKRSGVLFYCLKKFYVELKQHK